jgi:hypothetical protein
MTVFVMAQTSTERAIAPSGRVVSVVRNTYTRLISVD